MYRYKQRSSKMMKSLRDGRGNRLGGKKGILSLALPSFFPCKHVHLLDRKLSRKSAVGDVVVLGGRVLSTDSLIASTGHMMSILEEQRSARANVAHSCAAIILQIVGPERSLVEEDVGQVHSGCGNSRRQERQHVVAHHSVLKEIECGRTRNCIGPRDLEKTLQERVDCGDSETEAQDSADVTLHFQNINTAVGIGGDLYALCDLRSPHFFVLSGNQEGSNTDQLELGTSCCGHGQVTVHDVDREIESSLAKTELDGDVNKPVNNNSAHLLRYFGLAGRKVCAASGVLELLLEVHIANFSDHIGAVRRNPTVSAVGVRRDIARASCVNGRVSRAALGRNAGQNVRGNV